MYQNLFLKAIFQIIFLAMEINSETHYQIIHNHLHLKNTQLLSVYYMISYSFIFLISYERIIASRISPISFYSKSSFVQECRSVTWEILLVLIKYFVKCYLVISGLYYVRSVIHMRGFSLFTLLFPNRSLFFF